MSTVYEDPFQEAVARFGQLEEIEHRRAEAMTAGRLLFVDLMDTALQEGKARLAELCDLDDVHRSLEGYLAFYRACAEDIRVVQTGGFIQDEAIAEREQALNADLTRKRASSVEFRLAERVLGTVSLRGSQTEDARSVPEDKPGAGDTVDAQSLSVDSFFSREPEIVATELVGRVLEVNGYRVVILGVRPQDGVYNQKFLNRPVFGSDRRDVYIATFRANPMIFLRAGDTSNTDCCVCLMEVELSGQRIQKPTKVAKALGLTGEQVGDLVFEGEMLRVTNLEARNKS